MATGDGETQQQAASSPTSPSAPVYPAVERSDSDPGDTSHMHSSRTPSNASSDFPLLPSSSSDGQPRTSRRPSLNTIFISSPLNPNAPVVHAPIHPSLFAGSRPQARQSLVFNRVASEESQALTSQQRSAAASNRTSMILYRVADENEQRTRSPPVMMNRQSVLSNSGESAFSVSYDSKYPFGAHTPHKLIPYPFDPSSHINTPEDDDALHDPSDNTPLAGTSGITIRGFVNIGVLVLVIVSLLFLFIFYPVWHYATEGNSPVQ